MAESPKFVELRPVDGCGTCAFCTAPSPREKRTEPAAGRAPARACRRRAAGALLAVATSVVGIEAGTATPASALPAPSSEGWDGTRYWFESNGQWRWTSHQNVYLQRTGKKKAAPVPVKTTTARTPASGQAWLPAPSRAGWDGTRYWFESNGQWRWTSHQNVYLQRTGGKAGTGGTTAPQNTPAPPKANSGSLEPALSYALAQLGKPYIWGGNGYLGYDCSGLVQQAYRRAGIALPRVASDQYGATTKISSSSLRRGDLIFWSSNGRRSGVHHVAIYLGSGRYVEAPRPGVNIRVSSLSNGYAPNLFGRP
ncbi:NlpC/P60 family protein [Streptomyces sp. NBC_01754]|uniref:C40 family peptidase n=1 Tax=Streptomyces sp. NBC_01754 TaxID=2975930 RepID=UPI002DDC11F8|nr:NlpC/P60 family protein [Streptomyces sp. NBC_01754]WSC93850.1 NlpC/P60 family protein [Streptomyces sp. NBC_01754]